MNSSAQNNYYMQAIAHLDNVISQHRALIWQAAEEKNVLLEASKHLLKKEKISWNKELLSNVPLSNVSV